MPTPGLLEDCADSALQDPRLRALIALAHSENLWVSRCDAERCWLVDGPERSVPVPFGSSYDRWRRALLRAAGAERPL